MVLAELIIFALVLLSGLAVFALYILLMYNPWPKRTLEYMIQSRYKYRPEEENDTFDRLLKHENVKSILELRATEPSVYLSVVVPAMNEEDRLPVMLDDCLAYLEQRAQQDSTFTYEIIVVDDGSTDNTSKVAFGYSKKYPVYVLKLNKNVGKGGAVRAGILCARGSLILFADADGATKFSEFKSVEEALLEKTNDINKDKVVVIGSRAHLQGESKAKRTLFRSIMTVIFHTLVYIFAVRSIKDTQCGFKLFTRNAAASLFPRIHIERWAFDIELLYLAGLLNIPVKEVGVRWTEIEGSKINPFQASFEMARDIVLIWFRYRSGVWKYG